MKRVLITGAAAAAVLVASAPVALAQDEDGPTCVEAVLVVEANAKTAADAAVAVQNAALPEDVQDRVDAQMLVIADLRAKLDAALNRLEAAPSEANEVAAQAAGLDLNLAYDALGNIPGVQAFGAQLQALINARANLNASLAAQETACADVDAPEPTPTETPDPTPSTTPAPEPENVFNCVDFPLEDGTTAQQVLDRDSRDPHNLDTDNDGVACELDQPGTDPDRDSGRDVDVDVDVDVDDSVSTVPNDAPQTGDGSTAGAPLGLRVALAAVLVNVFAAFAFLRRKLS